MNIDLLNVIYTRRSIRKFTGERVKEDDLEAILRAGMSAPSAVNVQPWAFVVVTGRGLLDELCGALPYAKMLDKAGAAIIVCGVPDKDDTYAKDYWIMDCSLASGNILLAAHALGYGAVWTAAYVDQERVRSVRRILSIPENIIPLNVIPIGIPADRDVKPVDKFRRENIHWEKW
ncbi:MAG: nitroreductase family protein [Nitrospirae bacterium]|nr:nitroreductase family protein [Nitrospirota bacterium]